MLIRDWRVMGQDPMDAMIAKVNGNSPGTIMFNKEQLTMTAYDIGWEKYSDSGIIDGLYKRGSFGSHPFFDYETFPEALGTHPVHWLEPYGVCDTAQQVLDIYPILQKDEDRAFIVMFTPVLKVNQSSDGGWRWHKWGSYIGKENPECEYLYNEDIEGVFVYHIYERK